MGKTAIVFAGQGAQYPGMGKELYENFESAKRIIDMAEQLRPGTKVLCFEGSKDDLSVTINTQPCLFAVDLACAAVLSENGIKADGVAGFSLGEIPALVFSGLLDFESGFRFVVKRAQAMQRCAEETKGTMLAVLKLSSDKVEALCREVKDAYPVNFNCEGQTVVACKEEIAALFSEKVTASGGKAIKLSVSGAFHSPYMESAAAELHDYLKTVAFQEAALPLYANATAKIYDNSAELLEKQVKSPVLWQKTIEHMIADGFDTFIEVGAGKTLSGLIKKISPDVKICNVEDLNSLNNTLKMLNGGTHA